MMMADGHEIHAVDLRSGRGAFAGSPVRDYWCPFIFPCEAGLGALDGGRFRAASRCVLSMWCGPKADQSRQRRELLSVLPRVVRRGTWLATAAAVRSLLAPIAATRETG